MQGPSEKQPLRNLSRMVHATVQCTIFDYIYLKLHIYIYTCSFIHCSKHVSIWKLGLR